jgi:hypothetical protein
MIPGAGAHHPDGPLGVGELRHQVERPAQLVGADGLQILPLEIHLPPGCPRQPLAQVKR